MKHIIRTQTNTKYRIQIIAGGVWLLHILYSNYGTLGVFKTSISASRVTSLNSIYTIPVLVLVLVMVSETIYIRSV